MDLNSLQRTILAVAQSAGLNSALQQIISCMAEEHNTALARAWLIAPGDICSTCPMRSICPDQERCLHLVASAGNPLMEPDSEEGRREDWTRLNGQFQRIPLNTSHFSNFASRAEPTVVHIQDGDGEQLRPLRPEWIRAQKIRSFASHPLVFKNDVFGVLAVFSRREPSESDFEGWGVFASLAALAQSNTQAADPLAVPYAGTTAMAERWRSVFEKSAIGVALSDVNGRFLNVNQAYERLLGYTQDELRKLSFFDITPEEFRESNRSLAKELWAGRLERYQFEKPYRRKDGDLVWVRLHASLVPGTGSAPRFALALCEDITERKRAEESLRKNEERWRTLLEINNALITKLNQNELFHAICEALKRVVPFGRVALILHDPAMGVLRLAALEGPFRGENFAVGYEVGPESVSRWVFDHHRPVLRKDLETESQFPTERLLLAEGIRSLCALPLIVREETCGVLFVGSAAKAQYSDDDVSFLQEVANQVALAVGNMKSYEEIGVLNTQVTRTADHLRTLLEINNAIITNLSQEALLRSMAEALRRVVPFDRAALTLYHPDKDVFRFVGIVGSSISDYFRPGLEIRPEGTSVGWVFHHQRPLLRRDLEKEQQYSNERRLAQEGMRSHCVVPLIVRGKSIGTLNVASSTPNQYSEEVGAFLQEIAKQVALALENMKSYEEIATLKARLQEENIYLQEEIRTEHNFEEIVGNSPALLQVLRAVEQVAPTDSTVLIYGETGTGKELIARAIHDRSARKDRPLVRVDCSAIPSGLVESELFGHLKGAFTGALERRTGRFELADGGTIFLDEVGELPLETQVKLLRALQEHEFEPVGSSRTLHVDVRVIAATNRDLEEAVNAGRFRSDLFYRLNVFPLNVPPLRDRRRDIPQLVTFYLFRSSKKLGKKVDSISQETMERFVNYPWPGNVRELQNVIERAVILSPGSALIVDQDLLPRPTSEGGSEKPEPSGADAPPEEVGSQEIPTLHEVERRHILAALQQTGGVIEGPKGAARILSLHPNTLRHRMQKLGIRRPGHRPR